jgi:hypothetical protein
MNRKNNGIVLSMAMMAGAKDAKITGKTTAIGGSRR